MLLVCCSNVVGGGRLRGGVGCLSTVLPTLARRAVVMGANYHSKVTTWFTMMGVLFNNMVGVCLCMVCDGKTFNFLS